MTLRAGLLVAFLFIASLARAQSLEFLGLPSISFGMPLKDLPGRQLLMDTSSTYRDTALYLRNTRCQMYYQKGQDLQLKGFTATHIEYEFCDSALGYVFVYVSGQTSIDSALATLKITFPKMSCGKHVPLGSCGVIDTHNSKLRLIVHIDQATKEMNFVLIPRHAAR